MLRSRNLGPDSPPVLFIIELQEVFNLADISSILEDKSLSEKYLELYKEKLSKISNSKDPVYGEYLERKAKVYFNLKEYQRAVETLREAGKLFEDLGKVDPKLAENAQIMNTIADNIQKEHLAK